jgi:hypothetical protein
MLFANAVAEINDPSLNATLACVIAEHVLHLFEDEYPGDWRPRLALSAALEYQANPCPDSRKLAIETGESAWQAALVAGDDAESAEAADLACGAWAAEPAAMAAVRAIDTISHVSDGNVGDLIRTSNLAEESTERAEETATRGSGLFDLGGGEGHAARDAYAAWQIGQMVELAYPEIDGMVACTAVDLFDEFSGSLADLVAVSQSVRYSPLTASYSSVPRD